MAISEKATNFMGESLAKGKSLPGQSLTNSPDQPYNWERPVEFSNPKETMMYVFENLTVPETTANILLSISNGVGVSANVVGIGVDAFYGGSSEDILDDEGVVTEEGSQIWATRLSYGASAGKVGYSIGLSLNSNEAQLIDVSVNSDLFETSFEYDLSEEADGAYWLRGVVNPDFLFGAYLLVGYNSDEEVLYGVGYKCSDNFKFATEFSSDDEDDSGITFRASYSF